MTRNLRPMRVRVTRPIRCRCGGWAAEKAATFDEWGVFIAALFARDPGAIVGRYDSPDELRRAWTEPVIA
jgi:hypothetical protein